MFTVSNLQNRTLYVFTHALPLHDVFLHLPNMYASPVVSPVQSVHWKPKGIPVLPLLAAGAVNVFPEDLAAVTQWSLNELLDMIRLRPQRWYLGNKIIRMTCDRSWPQYSCAWWSWCSTGPLSKSKTKILKELHVITSMYFRWVMFRVSAWKLSQVMVGPIGVGDAFYHGPCLCHILQELWIITTSALISRCHWRDVQHVNYRKFATSSRWIEG